MSAEGQLDIPKPTIKRIVKEKLAAAGSEGAKADVQLNKEALLAFGESSKVFISYITATANDLCKDKKRATLSADDVFQALEETDFAELLPQLRESFEAYKQSLKEKKEKKAETSRKRKSAGQTGDGQEGQADTAAAADKSTSADAGAGRAGWAAEVAEEAAAGVDEEVADAEQEGDEGGPEKEEGGEEQ